VRVISGVPPDSVLGPIIFIIFMNNVCNIIAGNTTCKLFADGIKLYASVDFNGISHDLHASLDNLMLWSNMWQLKVNINKCNVYTAKAVFLVTNLSTVTFYLVSKKLQTSV